MRQPTMIPSNRKRVHHIPPKVPYDPALHNPARPTRPGSNQHQDYSSRTEPDPEAIARAKRLGL